MSSRRLVPTVLLAALGGTSTPAFAIGPPTHAWSNLIPMRDTYNDAGNHFSLAIDPGGNITVVTVIASNDEFGSWYDTVVRRYGADGSFQWEYWAGFPLKCVDVALDSEGNAVVVGWRDQTPAAYIVKLDGDGDVAWSRESVGYGRAFAVHVTPDDGVFVAGEFGTAIDLGGGTLTGGPGGAFFLAHYDRDGVYRWTRTIVVTGRDVDWFSQAMVVDGNGDLFAMGRFGGQVGGQPVDFGGGPLVATGVDVFLAGYYGSNGAHRVSRRFGSSDVDEVIDLEHHVDGDLLVYGHNSAAIDLGGGALAGPGFIAKFDGDGNHIWSRSSGEYNQKGGIASAIDGSVITTGAFVGTIDLGGGPLQSAGGTDVYLAAFDAEGGHQWSRRFGDANGSYGGGVGVADGVVVVSGFFSGTIDFGGGTLTATGWDLYLAKFTTEPTTVAITSFHAEAVPGAVALRAVFRSDLGVDAVNIYRADGDGPLALIASVDDGDRRGTFEYVDRAVVAGRSYRYQIGVVDADGEFFSAVTMVTLPSIAAGLSQNVPNPFNPATTIGFSLPSRQAVAIVVYDASGRLVRTLVDEVGEPGEHEVTWNGRDDRGVPVGSGVYFYQLRAGKYVESKKMVLIK